MPSNSSASMFGGAGGRGSKASVGSLEGLRSVLRNVTDKDPGPVPTPAPVPAAAPPAPAAPDDKQTLRGLNGRLSGYLNRVKQLETENRDLQEEIDEILARRKTPEGRNWDEVEKPLDGLKNKVKDITMDNAKLLLQIDNTKLANDDFKNKLDDETKARQAIESDLEDLRKNIEDTKMNNRKRQREIELLKGEVAHLAKEHRAEVEALREKIRDSEVIVEMDSKDSDLAEILSKVRRQYCFLAERNLGETEEWYHNKFENIKAEEAQNTEALQRGKVELKDLLKQKQYLELKVQSGQSMIHSLEENLRNTKLENGQRLAPLNQLILKLEGELKKVRTHLQSQLEMNKDLLCIKMKLEEEINNYQRLLVTDADSLQLSLEDALSKQCRPDGKLQEQQGNTKEDEAPKKPAKSSTVPLVNSPNGGDHLKEMKGSSSSSSSSSPSSSSENEDEKPEKTA